MTHTAVKTNDPPGHTNHRGLEIVAALLLVPTLLPLMVVFTPTLYLDSDPRLTGISDTAISFGPAGMIWLSVAAILTAGLAMASVIVAGGKIHKTTCILAVLGVIPGLYHMPDHFHNRFYGAAWIAAVATGLAAAHLAQFTRPRKLMATVLIAMVVPFVLQASWYIYVEQPMTLQSFYQSVEEGIPIRGMTPGTTEYTKYLTRLTGNDAIGVVGMSNVFGSIAAALTAMSLVVLFSGIKRRFPTWRFTLLLAAVIMGGVTLWLTRSRGAMCALAIVSCFAIALWLSRRVWERLKPRWVGGLCLLVVMGGIGVVVIRGMMGPPSDYHGERSLLFRFHYWQGAMDLIRADMSRLIFGVGPGSFKDLYETVRNPISPEVISSTHNVFIDYLVMLGVGGVAWSLLLLRWTWSAGCVIGRHLAHSVCDGEDDRYKPVTGMDKTTLRLLIAFAAVLFGIQYAVQFPGLYAETALLWLVSLLGYLGLAVWGIYPCLSAWPGWLNRAIGLASLVLMLHAQIEMTFYWHSAASFAWLVVGLSSADETEKPNTVRTIKWSGSKWLVPAALLICAIIIAVYHATPVTTHQSHLRNASMALSNHSVEVAIRELDAASAVIPNDPITIRWQVGLRYEMAATLWSQGRQEEAEILLNSAFDILDRAEKAGLTGVSSWRRRASLARSAYDVTGNRRFLETAVQAMEKVTTLSPNSLNDHVKLGDLLWEQGRFSEAESAYRRALAINDNFYLDPDTQLPESERERIARRLVKPDTP